LFPLSSPHTAARARDSAASRSNRAFPFLWAFAFGWGFHAGLITARRCARACASGAGAHGRRPPPPHATPTRSITRLALALGTRAPEIGRRCMHEQEEERRRRRWKRWAGGPSRRRRQGVGGRHRCRVHERRPPRGVRLRRLLRLVPPLPPAIPVPPQTDRRPFIRFILFKSSSPDAS